MVSQVLSTLTQRLFSRRPPRRLGLFLLWGGIFALALGMFFCRQRLDPLPSRDSECYIYWAGKIAASSWREALQTPDEETLSKPPLLLSLMAVGVRVGIDAKTAGDTLMLLSYLLLCTALALIAEELWGDWRLTAATLLFAAMFPICVRYSVQILRDPLYWCLAAWSIWWAMRAADGKNSWWNWISSAICCGLAILTRREGVELTLIVGLWMLFSGWRRADWRRILLRKIAAGTVFLAVIALLVLPVEYKMAQWGSRWNAGQLSAIRYYWSRIL